MGLGGQRMKGRVVCVCVGGNVLGLLCVGEEERGYWVVKRRGGVATRVVCMK